MAPARAPAPRKRPPPPPKQEGEDVFTDTIERILSAAEGREGHLIEQDLEALTQLCTQQASLRSLNGPLGFADVDVSWTAQLMEGLQRLVTIASSIDFVQAGYQGIQACKDGDEFDSIESVRTSKHAYKSVGCGGKSFFFVDASFLSRTACASALVDEG